MTTSSPREVTRLFVLAAVLVVSGIVFSGCSLLFPSGPERDPETGEIIETDEVSTNSLRVGDCTLVPEDANGEVAAISVTPCDEPHLDEVFHSFEPTGEDFPGEAAITEELTPICTAEFERFVGIDQEESAYYWWQITPTESSWKLGEREVLCLASALDGSEITGTLNGIAK